MSLINTRTFKNYNKLASISQNKFNYIIKNYHMKHIYIFNKKYLTWLTKIL